jgi:hypothetical protein
MLQYWLSQSTEGFWPVKSDLAEEKILITTISPFKSQECHVLKANSSEWKLTIELEKVK